MLIYTKWIYILLPSVTEAISTFHIGFTEENYISTKLKEFGGLFPLYISMLPCY